MMICRKILPVVLMIAACFLSACAELHELREIKTTQDQRIQDLENKNYNLKIEREKEQIGYTSELEKLQKQVTDLQLKQSEREKKLEEENFLLSKNLQTAKNQIDTAESQIKKQSEDFIIFKTESKTSLDQKLSDIRMLEDTKTTLDKENDDLKSQVKKLEEQLAEEKNLRNKAEKQLTERDALVSDLTSQVNDLKTQIKNVNLSLQRKTPWEKGVNTPLDSLLNDAETRLQKDLSSEISSRKIDIRKNKQGLVIHLYSDDLFDKGTVIVSENVKPMLLKISSCINKTPNFDVYVEGHTDNTPIQNLPFLDNLALSSSRADNVLRFIVEEGGVDHKRAKSVACSWFHPLDSNDTPEGRRENRRVEIILKPR
ncbi:OmpA family protein [Candidatus Sumerlaeota bacterium]|nr:OmpA family protein [Candidatus Sumerlaeota bacterium]